MCIYIYIYMYFFIYWSFCGEKLFSRDQQESQQSCQKNGCVQKIAYAPVYGPFKSKKR